MLIFSKNKFKNILTINPFYYSRISAFRGKTYAPKNLKLQAQTQIWASIQKKLVPTTYQVDVSQHEKFPYAKVRSEIRRANRYTHK